LKLRALFLLVAIAICANQTPTFAEWKPSDPPTKDKYRGILAQGVVETYTTQVNPSLLSFQAEKYEVGGTVSKVSVCTSFPTEACNEEEYQKYRTALGMCTDFKSDCVEEVIAEREGKPLKTIFKRYFPEMSGENFEGNDRYNLPSPGNTFLISIPEAPHAYGDNYLVAAVLQGERWPNRSNQNFSVKSFEVAIWPVQLLAGNYPKYREATTPSEYSGLTHNVGYGGSCGYGEVQTTGTECAKKTEPPKGLTLGIKLRLKAEVSGWFSGRASNVDMKIKLNDLNEQVIELKGQYVVVPSVFAWVKRSELPTDLKNYYEELGSFWSEMGSGYGCEKVASSLSTESKWECAGLLRNPGNSAQGMKELSYWLPLASDKAVTSESSWYLRAVVQGISDRCPIPKNRLVGNVTTNATTFVPGPPTFNDATQSLDYKVLAPHYLEDGTEFLGTYDLNIDSAIARCLYGFTNAPISATVSVVSDAGENKIAVTQVSEKNGFINLGAYGFTFSSPTLRVTLTQEKKVETKPEATATIQNNNDTASKSAAATTVTKKKDSVKATITCVKGKVTRKISGANAKCPQGFRKK